MMRIYIFVFLLLSYSLFAIPVEQDEATIVAEKHLNMIDQSHLSKIFQITYIHDNGRNIGYIFRLVPKGYIVLSADTDLPPIIAYSTTSTFDDPINEGKTLETLVTYDLGLRYHNLHSIPVSLITEHQEEWTNLLGDIQQPRFQQWPPEGTTASGGWLKTNWTQSSPYNMYCPMDLATGTRSLAGCPAVAMGQIVNYYATINGTTFSDNDDYHHNYSGNNYWIDNDSATYGFPSFSNLNAFLDTMMHHYRYQEEITNSDKAALVFACGVAAHQVYASAGSGTFSVNQALQAYQRFYFNNALLLTEDIPELYMAISQNIMNAMPVHLAIESPDESSGHNVVVDGYNTNEFYHLNFGWGSAYDGWYLLPDDLPFGLTMIEGAIVDIKPIQYISVSPDTLIVPSTVLVNQPMIITIYDIYSEADVVVENCLFDCTFADMNWEVQHEPFPKVLIPGDSTSFILIPHAVGSNSGNFYQTNLRIILDNTAVDVPIQYQSTVSNNDGTLQTVPNTIRLMQNYPNPFNPETKICYLLAEPDQVTLNIYNIRGELVKRLVNEIQIAGHHDISWDGNDQQKKQAVSGIYMYRLKSGNTSVTKKMILLK